jgi:hypothetical protein
MNQIANNLKTGFYDTPTHKFEQVNDWKEAGHYGEEGGLSLAVWKNPNGHGHGAAVTGSYDGYKEIENLRIFQAGRMFGYSYLWQGFKKDIWGKIEFYKWRKRKWDELLLQY